MAGARRFTLDKAVQYCLQTDDEFDVSSFAETSSEESELEEDVSFHILKFTLLRITFCNIF